MLLSVVTTIYRTGPCVVPFFERAALAARELGCELEVVFVNDGSPDDGLATAERAAAEHPGIVVVDLSRNFGQHKALWAGLRAARGDLIAIFDGDLEEDPHLAADFARTLRAQRADVVYSVARDPKGSWAYRRCRALFYRILRGLSGVEFPQNAQTARLMTRRYVDALLQHPEREIFLLGVLHMTGFRQVAVPVDKPQTAPTKYTSRKLFWVALNAVVAFSIFPLLIIFLTGIALSCLTAAFLAVLLATWATRGFGVPGWTTLVALQLISMSVVTLFLGILAVYVGIIFLEVKRRPTPIVRSTLRDGHREPELPWPDEPAAPA